MKEITRYACEYCRGQYNLDEIVGHEQKCKKEYIREQNIVQIEKDNIKYVQDAESFDDIFIRIQNVCQDKGYTIIFEKIGHYFTDISNSHDCPIDGITNWHIHDDKPTSYKGWSSPTFCGTITPEDINILDLLEIVFGNQNESFDPPLLHADEGNIIGTFDCSCHIFLDDFPNLKKKYIEFEQLDNEHNQDEQSIKKYLAQREFERKSFVLNNKKYIAFIQQLENLRQESIKLFDSLIEEYNNQHVYCEPEQNCDEDRLENLRIQLKIS